MKQKTHRVSPPIRMAALVLAFVALSSIVLTSCNVTRTITTTSSAYQRGDTCVSIQTITKEVYDATKKTTL